MPADGTVTSAVSLWQNAVHVPGIYDLEVNTSLLSPEECAEEIFRRLQSGPPPTAFPRLAAMGTQ
jgi:chloramphenicol 3-O phosphotransferase